ncbi:protein kinase domain-containing protein [Streptomyces sp. 8N706]|uniref:protein kinase domain-containing protein n=1 Tax=Streptomyces sp. 8N706 TaxID=3457416 RepID=UPI003FCF6AE3
MDELRTEDPQWIGEYRLLGRLGAGGMGRVYLARSERGRTVAVKLVQAELAHQSDFRRRFAQEVESARRVGGRWTAPVLDADTEADTPWVATGYIGGPSLHAVVAEDFGPLPEHSVRVLADGLAHALRDIHGAGLVHRDLKPSNVLITIDGPRVIDFGIARAVETPAGGGLTMTGAVVGSPGFMSPEQVRGERVSTASDLFCLGSVLAFAATGRQPFGTADSGLHALMFRIAEEEPDLTGLPDGLRELVLGCLAKSPAERFTVEQVIERSGDGSGEEPWLPGGLLARLGRDALQLLEAEIPRASTASADPSGAARPFSGGPSAASPPLSEPRSASAPPLSGPHSASAPPSSGAPSAPQAVATPPSVTPLPSAQPPPVAPALSTPASPGHPWTGGTTAPYLPGPAPAPYPRPHHPAAPPVWRSPRALGTWLAVLLGISGVFTLIDLTLNSTLYGAYTDYFEGTGTLAAITDRTTSIDAVGVFAALISLATIVVWPVWFRRLHINAELLAPRGQRFSRGWAVGSWFVPVAQLWIPKQMVNDIWRASVSPAPGPYPGRPGAPRRNALLNWWWGLYLTMCLSGLVSALVFAAAVSHSDHRGATAWAILTDLAELPASALAVAAVLRLTFLQEKRAGGGQGATGPYGPGYGRRY